MGGSMALALHLQMVV
jgi:hypothetical protein